MAAMKVPLVDLGAQHREVRAEMDAAFNAVVEESHFIGGGEVATFESEFAAACGTTQAVGLASGTDALKLGLHAMGVGRGDLVVTVPHTFIATVEAAIQLGAEPRFVDIDARTYNMDPSHLSAFFAQRCRLDDRGAVWERDSGRRIAAIVPVHLYGLPADMNSILAVANPLGIPVLEDACQAHGASLRGKGGEWRMAGSLGRAAAFSFYPGKNLGAIGDAGALVTNDDELAARVRLLSDHGSSSKYLHETAEGSTARLDALQAAILTIKLARLTRWNAMRKRAADWYREELSNSSVGLPFVPDGYSHVYHLFEVCVPERATVQMSLAELGIQTGLHYPTPLHLQPALAGLNLGPGSYPAAEMAASHLLSLPMFPHITREQVAYVAQSLRHATGSAPATALTGHH